MESDIDSLKSDLTSVITAQISALRADTIKWIVSALAFNFVATAGLIITLIKVFGK